MGWQCASCLQANPAGTNFCGHCGARAPDPVPDALAAGMAELVGLMSADASAGWERSDERRLITALFADVSGFTSLADRLDPEQLIERMDPILERMGQIVERYEGHVNKYAGDAILAFFGAPVAHEDDAVRAVLAARDMHREIAEVVATLPDDVQHLTLHIGVNTGHVVTGFRGGQVRLDYSVLGDAVNVAQRLEAASSGGEIYVGELTYSLAHKALPFESVGEIVVKGKPEPIRAWRVIDDAEITHSVRDDDATYGRDSELGVVDDALASVAAGRPVLLALVGEPGVGKSRLLQEAQARASGAGIRWYGTRCLSYGASLTYRPYLDLIRQLAGVRASDAPDDVRSRVASFARSIGLDDEAPYLVHAAGVPSPDIPPQIRDNAQALRVRLQDAVTSTVVALAEHEPIAMAIEDLHWMDDASLDLTELIVARSTDVPLFLAVTTRPEGMPSVQRLRVDRAHVVELSGLDVDAARSIAQAMVGAPLAATTIADLVNRTGGNALFVQEVVRALLDAGALTPGPDGWTMRAGDPGSAVPSTIESVLAARIDLLPREAADVLQAASVIGRDVRLPMLRELVPMSEEKLERIVELLVERQFLNRAVETDQEKLVFHHALVADVAYGRLLRRRRREIHRRLVDVGLRLYGSGDDVIDLLARHAYLGGMGSDALPYIERAGDRATAIFANAAALSYLQQAIEIAEADGTLRARLAELLTKRGELLARTGRFGEAVDDFERGYRMSGAADAALSQASALMRLDQNADCLQLLAAVERDHPDLSTVQRAAISLTRARIMTVTGHPAEARQLLSDGIADLTAAGDAGSVTEADLRIFRARLSQVIGAREEAMHDIDVAQAILEEADDLPRMATALRTLGGLLHASADLDSALAVLRRALSIARQVGHAEEIGAAAINISYALCEGGRLDEALASAEEAARAFASMGLMSGVANARVNQCDILIDLGRLDEAKTVAEEALALARQTGHQRWYAGALATLAEIALQQGDYAAVALHGTESVEIFEAMGEEDQITRGRERLAAAKQRATSAS